MPKVTLDAAKEASPIAEVGLACGRGYLDVAGIVVAMEGDPIREANIPADVLKPPDWASGMGDFYRRCWSAQSLEWVAGRVNKEVESRLAAANKRADDAYAAGFREAVHRAANAMETACECDDVRGRCPFCARAAKIRALAPAAPTDAARARCGACPACELDRIGCACDGAIDYEGCFVCDPKIARPPCPKRPADAAPAETPPAPETPAPVAPEKPAFDAEAFAKAMLDQLSAPNGSSLAETNDPIFVIHRAVKAALAAGRKP